MAKFHPLDYTQFLTLFRIGYLLVGANDQVLTSNQEARIFLEAFKPCNLDNCTLYDVLPELYDSKQKILQLVREKQQSLSLPRLWRRGTDDNEYYLDIYVEPYPDSSAHLIIILQDVSEQARQEKKMRKQHNELKMLFSVMETQKKQLEDEITQRQKQEQQMEKQHNELKLLFSVMEAQKIQLEDEIAQRQKAEARLQILATSDPLTGIFNRRHFFDIFRKELARSRRYERPISIIMFDLDHFKRVNDTYGHQAGDMALMAIVKRCQQSLRDIDILARYGGEEFVVLLPETTAQQAAKTAERLRALIEIQPFQFDNRNIAVTVSLGVAGLDKIGPGLTGDYLLSIADEALYQAKRAGRNRVCVAE